MNAAGTFRLGKLLPILK